MSVFVIRRLMQALLVVFLMSVIVFFGVNIVGDPVYMLVSPDADQADIEAAIRRLGLDRPIWDQYLLFLKGAAQGNLGDSFIFGEPALKLILHHMPATLELAFSALMLAIVIGIPLGLFSGLYPDNPISKGIMAGSILGFSLPTFWVGLMLILLFAVELGWLPSTGRGDTATIFGIETSLATWDGLRHIFLPALNLALLKISLAIRLDARGRAGSDEPRLCEIRKGQGHFDQADHLCPCDEEHHDPGRDSHGPGIRQPHRILCCDRNDLCLARNGQVADRCHSSTRPARRRRLPDDHGAVLRGHQPGR
jgi:hypothetical protein